jgi:hypothetical protein
MLVSCVHRRLALCKVAVIGNTSVMPHLWVCQLKPSNAREALRCVLTRAPPGLASDLVTYQVHRLSGSEFDLAFTNCLPGKFLPAPTWHVRHKQAPVYTCCTWKTTWEAMRTVAPAFGTARQSHIGSAHPHATSRPSHTATPQDRLGLPRGLLL